MLKSLAFVTFRCFAAVLAVPPLALLPTAAGQAVKANRPQLFVIGELAVGTAGPALTSLFDPSRIQVVLSPAAVTPRTFIDSGRWDSVLPSIHPGDFVLIDFGPDPSAPATASEDRDQATRTLSGYGDGTFDYLDPGTHKLELVHSYGWYLRRMAVDVIARGGSPILCAPPSPGYPHRDPNTRNIAGQQSRDTQDAIVHEAVPREPGLPAVNAPADTSRYIDPPAKENTTYADWAAYIAVEQRIPLLDLSQSPATPSVEALLGDLQALKPDPLQPYLTGTPRRKPD